MKEVCFIIIIIIIIMTLLLNCANQFGYLSGAALLKKQVFAKTENKNWNLSQKLFTGTFISDVCASHFNLRCRRFLSSTLSFLTY